MLKERTKEIPMKTVRSYLPGCALALVIGSEGDGMGRLVAESCDFIVSLPMKGKVSSLNASAAAAITMYEILRQRMG